MFRQIAVAAGLSLHLVLGGALAAAAPVPSFPSGPDGSGDPGRVPSNGPANQVSLKLERDGTLSVTEQITAPADRVLTRTVPLRFAVGERADRLFEVRDARVDGSGSASQSGDEFRLTVTGNATVRYTVLGSIVDLADHQEVRWQAISGWDTAFRPAQVSFVAPERPRALRCLAGPLGSATRCTRVDVSAAGFATAQDADLRAGQRLDLIAELPPGTAPAKPITDETSWFGHAFGVTPQTGVGLLALAALLLAGGGTLVYVRGRDKAVSSADVGTVEVLQADGRGNVTFCSPDGVLPGQLGTVLDEHVDVIDVTASVLDLAVRDYLWISEVAGSTDADRDWWIVRRNPPDDALTAYERALYETVLPGGAERVLLSELAGTGVSLGTVPERLYAEVVAHGWFSRRPDTERRGWRRVGLGVATAGLVLTVVLALSVGYALFGVLLVVAGLAFAAAARLMPARTRRGAVLLAQIRGLREYLHTVSPEAIPPTDRELVFSRSLPYAVVLGETERWLAAFARLDSAADGTPGLYWYADGTPRQGTDLVDFAPRCQAFLLALDGVLARSAASAPTVR